LARSATSTCRHRDHGPLDNPYDFSGAAERLGRTLVSLRDAGIDMLVVLGDIVHEGDPDSLAKVLGQCAGLGVPVWVVAGNHESIRRDDAVAAAVAALRPNLRMADPSGVPHSGVRIAGLPILSHDGGRTAEGTALPAAAGWGERLTVWLSHYPVLSLGEELRRAGILHSGDLRNRAAVAAALLERRGTTIVLHGHLHVRARRAHAPLLQASCGAQIEPPHEVTMIRAAFHDTTWVVDVEARSMQDAIPSCRLPILAPERTTWSL
jgi:predicted phosphodiesterase